MSNIVESLEYEYLAKPDYALVKVMLPANQTICVEASAMVSMDTNVSMKTKLKGGVMAGVKRVMAGESLVMNEFTAEGAPGEILLAPGPAGDIESYQLQQGQTMYLQSSCYVASTMSVKVETKFEGFKGFFGGAGVFLVKVTGPGQVFFNSYGAMMEIPVKQNYIVDTGYIVAFEDTLQYQVKFLGGLKTSLFGGEGLVCDFNGSGKLWIQTRKVAPFANWLWPFRPVRDNNN